MVLAPPKAAATANAARSRFRVKKSVIRTLNSTRLELRLACHAASSCGYGRQTQEVNRLRAIDAGPVSAIMQAGQRCTHVCELVAIALHLGIL